MHKQKVQTSCSGGGGGDGGSGDDDDGGWSGLRRSERRSSRTEGVSHSGGGRKKDGRRRRRRFPFLLGCGGASGGGGREKEKVEGSVGTYDGSIGGGAGGGFCPQQSLPEPLSSSALTAGKKEEEEDQFWKCLLRRSRAFLVEKKIVLLAVKGRVRDLSQSQNTCAAHPVPSRPIGRKGGQREELFLFGNSPTCTLRGHFKQCGDSNESNSLLLLPLPFPGHICYSVRAIAYHHWLKWEATATATATARATVRTRATARARARAQGTIEVLGEEASCLLVAMEAATALAAVAAVAAAVAVTATQVLGRGGGWFLIPSSHF